MKGAAGIFRASHASLAPALVIFLLLCLWGLFRGNLTSNEVTKFTDAMQELDPGWIPGLFPNGPEPGRRQWLFQLLMAPLLPHGFLLASIVGRLAGYALLAVGLAALRQSLGLRMLFFIPAVAWMDQYPSMVAYESVTRLVEPKLFSYGLVFLALGHVLRPLPRLNHIALSLGLATSMHVLVGFYASLAVGLVLLLHHRVVLFAGRTAWQAPLIYLAASCFAWRPLWTLWSGGIHADNAAALPASFLYSFIRVAHHVDPSTWTSGSWLRILFWCALFATAAALRLREPRPGSIAERGLITFTAGSLAIFAAGLAIAPFDGEGRWLRYYPFRLADVMLPFAACLLLALRVQEASRSDRGRFLVPLARVAMGVMLLVSAVACSRHVQDLRTFPGRGQGLSRAWLDTMDWIRTHTPSDAYFIVPPNRSASFPWLARRRVLGTFKQVTLSGGLQEWYRRMNELAAWDGPWPVRGYKAGVWLEDRYLALNESQVRLLMKKHGANYFLTSNRHQLGLPRVYQNVEYAVYAKMQETHSP
jgi:hypothetical protein